MSTDAASLHDLYQDHHGWLLSWLHRRLGGSDHAADLAQDTFVRVLRTPSQQPVREPHAYLATIARALIVDHFRRRELEQTYLQALAHLPEAETPSPEHSVLILETLRLVDAALDTLPVQARQTFLLSQLDGMRYAQIADRFGVSLTTVKRHMLRAFRACLAAV